MCEKGTFSQIRSHIMLFLVVELANKMSLASFDVLKCVLVDKASYISVITVLYLPHNCSFLVIEY